MGVKDSRTILEMLSSKVYRIPPYQRNYSWTPDDDVEQLWFDIQRVREHKIDDYFFGPMVFKELGTNLREVIDGQQRFASLSLFLAVVRDKLDELGQSGPAGEYHKFLDGALPGKAPQLRSTLNRTDSAYYEKLVLGRNTPLIKLAELDAKHPPKTLPQSCRLLRQCYDFFNNAVSQYSSRDKNGVDTLLELANCVLENFRVFEITVDSIADAYRVFNSINAKGLDLATADLIKVHLFSEAGSYLERAEKAWESMLDNLQHADVTKFIRRQWISVHGYVAQEDLFDEINRKETGPHNVMKYAEQLRDEASLYQAILNPDDKANLPYLFTDDEISGQLSILRKLGSEVTIPTLMSGLTSMERKEFLELSRMCVSLFFRYKTICNRHAGDLQELMVKVANGIRQGKMSMDDIKKEFGSINPMDSEFESSFAIAQIRNSAISKYILKELNNALSLKTHTLDSAPVANIQLEHIMPQNDKAAGWEHMASIHKEWVNRIGNLTLLTGKVNRSARDKPFNEKRDSESIYRKSMLPLNGALLKLSKWDENEIENRQLQFAAEAPNIWKL